MSTAVLESNLLLARNVLSVALPVPLPLIEQGVFLFFGIPTFQLQLTIPITEVEPGLEFGRATFTGKIEDDAILILTGNGRLNRKEDTFRIESVSIRLEALAETARADFIVSTIRAALVLAEQMHVQIPSLRVDLTARFSESLLEISQTLRRRQIDYRVMVIERTIEHEFQLPPDISGDEVRDITLAYRAITEHSFLWPIDSIELQLPATQEWADKISRIKQETSVPIGPDPFRLELFGHKFDLGQRGIIVQDAVIDNYEIACKQISQGGGQEVPVIIRSTSGQARYDFFGVPDPPTTLWNQNIQRLVELESQLDAALVNRYHALAASTLEGLTEEERIAITARPELDEKAF
ncbi:MAG: hypothetical protein LC785_02345 [Acidobacteria bacterium]|nr:hypothetical protein [Acidobacteriota bacterium]MCA1632474.1 hypothetical protein [Acidobacteriota bacterium]MCA1640827.1 hypothetical protein [Acidobacteriota bacterium]